MINFKAKLQVAKACYKGLFGWKSVEKIHFSFDEKKSKCLLATIAWGLPQAMKTQKKITGEVFF